jgi:hypothetical protein
MPGLSRKYIPYISLVLNTIMWRTAELTIVNSQKEGILERKLGMAVGYSVLTIARG